MVFFSELGAALTYIAQGGIIVLAVFTITSDVMNAPDDDADDSASSDEGAGASSGGTEPDDDNREPASEKTAKRMRSQINKDLGEEVGREFHDMKEKGAPDRTMGELRRDAQIVYDEAGALDKLPNWMTPR